MIAGLLALAWACIIAGSFLGFVPGRTEREFGFGIFFVALGFGTLLGLTLWA